MRLYARTVVMASLSLIRARLQLVPVLSAVAGATACGQQNEARLSSVLEPAHPQWVLTVTMPSGQLQKLVYESKEACEQDLANRLHDPQNADGHCDLVDPAK